MLSTETKDGRWYVAMGQDGFAVVDHEGQVIVGNVSEREGRQIARDHNAVRDALDCLRSEHIVSNIFRLGALASNDYRNGITRLEGALTLQEREAR